MASLIKRGKTYQMQWYEGEKKRRLSLKTGSLQIANEKLRQFESARYRGDTCPLPTKSPIGQVVSAFIAHMKAHRPRGMRRDKNNFSDALLTCPHVPSPISNG